MDPTDDKLTNSLAAVKWEVWYRDTFDRECPPKVDVSGIGLETGLKELWARHLFEQVRFDGNPGFSHFYLLYDGRRIDIDGDWEGARRIRAWMFGDKRSTMVGYVDEADSALLTRVAKSHGALLVEDKLSSSKILEWASRCANREEFERLVDGLTNR